MTPVDCKKRRNCEYTYSTGVTKVMWLACKALRGVQSA